MGNQKLPKDIDLGTKRMADFNPGANLFHIACV